MRTRFPTAMGLCIGIAFAAMMPQRGLAGPFVSSAALVGGFGKLHWGATVAQAQSIYRDLYFGSFAVEDSRDEPSKIYSRKDETQDVEGVAFDSIEYWFRRDRFYRVRAVMRSRIGPRSLITRSEESFDQLRKSLTGRYGKPAKYDEGYFVDFVTVVRSAEWQRPDATIVLEYKGPESTNEDRLIFELREGGGH